LSKIENWDFWILKILSFWTTLENGMEIFVADYVFEEFIKIKENPCLKS